MRNKTSFSGAPQIHHNRSMFDLSNQVSGSFQHGRLYPLGTPIEVIPGDTITLDMASLIRMNTPVNAFMGNIFCDVYAFFVPNRIVWNHWKQFMGEPDTEAWTETTEYNIPNQEVDFGDGYINTIGASYGLKNVSATYEVNELPLRGYAMIWNNYFRDQNYQNNILVTYGDSGNANIHYEDACARVNKLHDVFTSVLPSAQRLPIGTSVTLPLGNMAPVGIVPTSGSISSGSQVYLASNAAGSGSFAQSVGRVGSFSSSISGPLVADLSQATAATINDLRNAFAVQRYYEALARSGARYSEMLRGIFGVDPGDARAQIPEYLGGKRFPIQVNQVVATAGNNSTGTASGFNNKANVGATGATSRTFDSSSIFSKSFTEHGFVHILICFRKWNMYSTGLDKVWSKKDKFDFFLPQFAHIGEQPIMAKEVNFVNNSGDENVFGYQEAWYDYRFRRNQTLNALNPSAGSGVFLDTMTLAKVDTTSHVCSGDWLYEETDALSNVLSYRTGFDYLGDFQLSIRAARILPMYSVPGLLDHD